MTTGYPRFGQSFTDEELIEHFLLSEMDQKFIARFRGDVNCHGVAVLLKSLQFLGYFPHLREVPATVKLFIAKQLNLTFDSSQQYPWETTTRDNHFARIRQYTDFRFPTAADRENLDDWLKKNAALKAITFSPLFEHAIERLRTLYIELPAESELTRIVNSALNGFFADVHHLIAQRLNETVIANCNQWLKVAEVEPASTFEWVKAPAGAAGVVNLQKEVSKLQALRQVGVTKEHLTGVPFKVQKILFQRARNEKASEMQNHPHEIRNCSMACFITVCTMQVIDDIVQMFVKLIHRIDVRAENQRDKQLLADFSRVEGKTQILYRVAEVVTENPDGTIRDVIFPKVKPETFLNLVAEKKASGSIYHLMHQRLMLSKYAHHYRRMLPMVLENLTFHSGNRLSPIITALVIIKRYLHTSYQYFPEPVPIDGIVPNSWSQLVVSVNGSTTRVNRKAYEMCVLQQLERALKCKEVWVDGSYQWRNPADDLPKDWTDETVRINYYQQLNQPIVMGTFVESIRREMTDALRKFNRVLPNSEQVSIYFPSRGRERGLFQIRKLPAQPEPDNISYLKNEIRKEYGMLDLLDLFVEADKLVDFTRFFTHTGTKEVRSREALRPLILMALFGEGTNMGIRRIANANQQYSYEQLLYVRKTYLSPQALREAIRAVVNKILALRTFSIWGHPNAVASDGKRFGAWKQNLMAEWRTRYKGYGVKVYWHVEKNAVSIYSQLKSHSASEAAAMIEGLIRHDTQMRVEKNFVDSHGQSEVAFAFCRLLNDFKLVPRLKRIKYEKLYLPDRGMVSQFPNLAGVLTRPIRWQLIEPQYDEMVKSTVAMKYGDATAEAILKRFSSVNATHPTYKALIELGKVEKTIFLCDYLSSVELQQETREALNVVENWNGTNDFIFYGRQGKFQTNDPLEMEVSMLCLHLLQNCLMLVNTILLERTIEQHAMVDTLTDRDRQALTPLFYGHINPYGLFELNLQKASFLEVT